MWHIQEAGRVTVLFQAVPGHIRWPWTRQRTRGARVPGQSRDQHPRGLELDQMGRVERKGIVEESWWDKLPEAQESRDPGNSSPSLGHQREGAAPREALGREVSVGATEGAEGGASGEEPRTRAFQKENARVSVG